MIEIPKFFVRRYLVHMIHIYISSFGQVTGCLFWCDIAVLTYQSLLNSMVTLTLVTPWKQNMDKIPNNLVRKQPNSTQYGYVSPFLCLATTILPLHVSICRWLFITQSAMDNIESRSDMYDPPLIINAIYLYNVLGIISPLFGDPYFWRVSVTGDW